MKGGASCLRSGCRIPCRPPTHSFCVGFSPLFFMSVHVPIALEKVADSCLSAGAPLDVMVADDGFRIAEYIRRFDILRHLTFLSPVPCDPLIVEAEPEEMGKNLQFFRPSASTDAAPSTEDSRAECTVGDRKSDPPRVLAGAWKMSERAHAFAKSLPIHRASLQHDERRGPRIHS